jgi:hypothetical protein
MSLPSRARATAALRATRRREKEAELDLGGRHQRHQPSRPHHLSTALARSDTATYYPEASLQAGPLSKQLKNPPGRHFGRCHRPAANFVPLPPPLPVLPFLTSTPRSHIASQPCSLDSALAPATSAPTRRTSNPSDSCAPAAAKSKPENISSSTARSTPHRAPPFFPPLRLKTLSLAYLLNDPRATKATLRFLADSGRFDSLDCPALGGSLTTHKLICRLVCIQGSSKVHLVGWELPRSISAIWDSYTSADWRPVLASVSPPNLPVALPTLASTCSSPDVN